MRRMWSLISSPRLSSDPQVLLNDLGLVDSFPQAQSWPLIHPVENQVEVFNEWCLYPKPLLRKSPSSQNPWQINKQPPLLVKINHRYITVIAFDQNNMPLKRLHAGSPPESVTGFCHEKWLLQGYHEWKGSVISNALMTLSPCPTGHPTIRPKTSLNWPENSKEGEVYSLPPDYWRSHLQANPKDHVYRMWLQLFLLQEETYIISIL